MLVRKLVLLSADGILLLAYHGGYLLSDWPWFGYYVMIAWWFAFSWYVFVTPKTTFVPGKINENEKSLPFVGQPHTPRYKQNDCGDSSLIIHSIYYSSASSNHTDSIICSYSETSDSGCGQCD